MIKKSSAFLLILFLLIILNTSSLEIYNRFHIQAQNLRPQQSLNPRQVQYRVHLKKSRLNQQPLVDEKQRSREQDDQRILEQGKEKIILYENLKNKYRIAGLPKIEDHYYETITERGFIVYFIAFPIVTIYSFLALQVFKVLSAGNTAAITSSEFSAIILASTLTATGITVYDYHQIKKTQNNADFRMNPFGKPLAKDKRLVVETTFSF